MNQAAADRALLLAVWAGLAGFAANAQSATDEAAADVIETPIVTGTRGEPRSVTDTPVPVDVIVGASNLFDDYAEESNGRINYFGNLPYDVLSPIGCNGRYVYGGARASF